MISLFFFFLGLIIWSFSNAVIWRVKNKRTFVSERSECTTCWHKLSAFDLVPLFSWLFLWWKCRYCKDKISIQYPLVELIFWICFWLIWYFLFPELIWITTYWIIDFLLILILVSVLLIISIYDILYLEIIDWLIIPVAFFFIALSFTSFWFVSFIDWFLGSLMVYTFLYSQILIPWFIFLFENKKYKEISTLFSSYFIFPFWMFFRLFFSEKKLDKFTFFKQTGSEDLPAWVGWGDLRFAVLMWFILWWKLTIIWVFASYIVWAVVSVSLILLSKIRKKELNKEVPFLPFLTFWTLFALFFGDIALELYMNYVNWV